jgi:hypothetical protein
MSLLTQEFVQRKKAGDIGIEIEVESLNVLPEPPEYWSMKRDDSLRNNGVEYYTKSPILCNVRKLEKISRLTNLLDKANVIMNSPRTSVHVHVNILRHTPLQVWTAVSTYWLLDNILIKYCGTEEREGNVFCLRAKDAEGAVDQAVADIKTFRPFASLGSDNVRYSSQNINAIANFGSLEYRGMRGTIDPHVIDIWSTELYNIVHRSKRFTDPADMIDTYLALGAERFMKLVLSDEFVAQLKRYGDIDRLTKENVGLLSNLCYLYDWRQWEKIVNNKYGSKMNYQDPEPIGGNW